ncbi:MAG: hypothetical protein AUREO_053980 [Aureobasidium pullulans]|nr:MAG: hypothetical protein AUREO_053980 [Aureobasidium pullulans]
MKNYPLPREHRILTPCQNSTSVSPPPSHPPTLNSGPKQNTPRQEDTLTTIISKEINRLIRFTITPVKFQDSAYDLVRFDEYFHEGTEGVSSVPDEWIDLSKPIGPFGKNALPCPIKNTGGLYSI